MAQITDSIKEQLKEGIEVLQNYDVPLQHQTQPIA